jgi:hypothetical protein
MSETPASAQPNFPAGLLRWAGHRDGAVRKAFAESGRPAAGKVFATEVVRRLARWASDVAQVAAAPRAVLLVGGPGNGKTDAVEQFVDALGVELTCTVELLRRCREANAPGPTGRPPRLIAVPLGDLMLPGAARTIRELRIVQDASVPQEGSGWSPERCLIEELAGVVQRDDVLYLCCLNRGVLADALIEARAGTVTTDLGSLLQSVAAAVAQGAIPRACWPLDAFPFVAVWPMDAESLITGRESPGRQMFDDALDPSRWTGCESCEAVSLCPFKTNRDALATGARLDALLSLLRRYEHASGKRWTFRDLYSLVPELLVGNESDFRRGNKTLDPCEWVRGEVQHADLADGRDPRRTRKAHQARLALAARLYQHALFPTWSALSAAREDARKACKDSTSGNREATKAVLDYFGQRRESEETQIRRLLHASLAPALDSAQADPDLQVTERRAVRDLDVAFSRGSKEGKERGRATQDLCELDRRVLESLELAEEGIGQGSVPRGKLFEAQRAQVALRQVAARYAKRSILVRRGISRDEELFRRYEDASTSEESLRRLQRLFTTLVNQGDGFRASLLRCVGQPRRSAARDVVLVTGRVRARARSIPSLSAPDRAPTSTPFLEVEVGREHHPIALTFSLFKALVRLDQGCHQASLPADVLALVQGLESKVAGRRIRDEEILQDEEVYIELLGGTLFIRAEPGGQFEVSARRPA